MRTYQGDAPPKAKRAKLKVTRSINWRHQELVNAVPIDIDDSDNQFLEDSQKQLVVFNPGTSDAGQEVSPEPVSAECRSSSASSFPSFIAPNNSSRVLPSVGAFAVQCATCFKWRLVPTKEKYEEIRENVLQDPFVCEKAREWRPDISCDYPADISQDGSRLWAIDKPNIAQPPPGWERILRIRGEGSTKFADVYYAAPSGKRLRSMVEVQKYLLEHPEYVSEGVNISQFSFQIPRPLQENYVRKRTVRLANPYEISGVGLSRPLEPAEVNPVSWVRPEANTNLQIGTPGSSVSLCKPSVSHPPWRQSLAKKKTNKSSSKQMYRGSACNNLTAKVEDVHEVGTYSHEI